MMFNPLKFILTIIIDLEGSLDLLRPFTEANNIINPGILYNRQPFDPVLLPLHSGNRLFALPNHAPFTQPILACLTNQKRLGTLK